MASLDMNGSYALDLEAIDAQVTRVSPGNYALGKNNENGKFTVSYVGRADKDVKARLKSWVGKVDCKHFKYSYATSPKAAFEKECKNYHDFNPPLNEIHPDRPNDTAWKCPYCNIFG